MGCVEKSKDGSTVCTNLFVNDPALLVIFVPFIMGFSGVLDECVVDAFNENLFGVLWP